MALNERAKGAKAPRRIPRIKPYRPRLQPLRARGPKGWWAAPVQTDEPGDKPAQFAWMTQAEWYVYWYLTTRRRFKEGPDFEVQRDEFGGRQNLGGQVVDFFFANRFSPGLIIAPQGETWHTYSTGLRAIDLQKKLQLESRGYTVVYMLEDEVLRNVGKVVDEALTGKQLYVDTV